MYKPLNDWLDKTEGLPEGTTYNRVQKELNVQAMCKDSALELDLPEDEAEAMKKDIVTSDKLQGFEVKFNDMATAYPFEIVKKQKREESLYRVLDATPEQVFTILRDIVTDTYVRGRIDGMVALASEVKKINK